MIQNTKTQDRIFKILRVGDQLLELDLIRRG